MFYFCFVLFFYFLFEALEDKYMVYRLEDQLILHTSAGLYGFSVCLSLCVSIWM